MLIGALKGPTVCVAYVRLHGLLMGDLSEDYPSGIVFYQTISRCQCFKASKLLASRVFPCSGHGWSVSRSAHKRCTPASVNRAKATPLISKKMIDFVFLRAELLYRGSRFPVGLGKMLGIKLLQAIGTYTVTEIRL